MHNRVKQVSNLILPVLLFSMLLLTACENDLKKIQEISSKYTSAPIDTTKGVEVIYSDSAIVKGKMTTPMMITYDISDPFYMMPKGVKVVFYDVNAQEAGSIVADSGVYHNVSQKIEFYRHVVYKTADGDTFKSDELIWDQLKKTMYSTKPVELAGTDGSVLYGTSFTSDDMLKYPKMQQANGPIMVKDSLLSK